MVIPYSPYPATANTLHLAAMTDQLARQAAGNASAQVVERFLYITGRSTARTDIRRSCIAALTESSVWSRPFQLNLWSTYRAESGCVDVVDTPYDSSSNSHWAAAVNNRPIR